MGKVTKFFQKINNKIAKKIIKWRWLVARDGLTNLETLKKFYLENKIGHNKTK